MENCEQKTLEQPDRVTYDQLRAVNDALASIDLKGKDYVMVNERIKAFRQLYPQGFIMTAPEIKDGVAIFRAEVGYYEHGQRLVLGTGTACEKEGSSFINKTSFVENAETSAVGRALGMAGIGIDKSVATYEEVANAQKQQASCIMATKQQIDTLCDTLTQEQMDAVMDKYGKDLEKLDRITADRLIKRAKETADE